MMALFLAYHKLHQINSNTKILIISSVWVEPNSSAAGSRVLQLIQTFLAENWKITYVSTATESDFSIDLSVLGIDTFTVQLNNSSFDVFLTKLQPSIVVFDRFIMEEQFGWRVAEFTPNTLRILDTEDLHCLRKAREIALKNNISFQPESILQTDISKREIASILRCDISLMISESEMEILQNIFKIDNQILHYIPFLLKKLTEKDINLLPIFSERQHFYFIGNFLHKPNYDAVLYLKKEIWPLISKQLPDTELHIFGAYLSQKAAQLNNPKERFYIKGTIPNTAILKQYKVCLAPLRFGAGIKGKLTEAMLYGTPSITTNIGAESMHQNLPWNGFIENSPKNFANAAIEIYTNSKLWEKSQKNGFTILDKVYDKDTYSFELIHKIKELMANIKQHRAANFLGNMLHHHTMNSTKYLSKWIEAKNK